MSPRTMKALDKLPKHAQHIYKKAHANALRRYKNPVKMGGGKRQSLEQIAHKVAWSAVKTKYEKEGNKWTRKKR